MRTKKSDFDCKSYGILKEQAEYFGIADKLDLYERILEGLYDYDTNDKEECEKFEEVYGISVREARKLCRIMRDVTQSLLSFRAALSQLDYFGE